MHFAPNFVQSTLQPHFLKFIKPDPDWQLLSFFQRKITIVIYSYPADKCIIIFYVLAEDPVVQTQVEPA